MSNVKTIILTGGETEIDFKQNYMCFWVQNLGSSDVYASNQSGIVPDSDGVISIAAGSSVRISTPDLSQINKLYLSGSGKVQIVGTYSVHCPFKTAEKGGGEDREVEKILSRALYRWKYEQGLRCTSVQIDTAIPQQTFENSKAMTVVFKINASEWKDCYGLIGMHSTEGNGYNMQHQSINQTFAGSLIYHHFEMSDDVLKQFINQTIIFTVSESEKDMFIMIDNHILAEEDTLTISDKSNVPYGNLTMLRSYAGSTTINRYFHGTVYDMIVFDRYLSKDEAAAVTNKLMNE